MGTNDKVYHERIRFVAYHLALPLYLANIHNVFHVSML